MPEPGRGTRDRLRITGVAVDRCIELPEVRGPLTERLFAALVTDRFHTAPTCSELPSEPIVDDDFQLALYVANELHFAGIDGVDDRWEWAPGLMQFRWRLEEAFLESVDGLVSDATPDELASVGHALQKSGAQRRCAAALQIHGARGNT